MKFEVDKVALGEEKAQLLGKKPLLVPLCLPQISCTDLGSNMCLCGEKLATNHVIHGTTNPQYPK